MDSVDAFELVTRLGTQVIEVPNLPRPLMYVREYDLALVRDDLSPECRAEVADWLLSACLQSPEPRR